MVARKILLKRRPSVRWTLLVTPMQQRIVRMLIEGYRQNEIGRRLNLLPGAVYAHIQRAKVRLVCRTVCEMVATVVRDEESRKRRKNG